MNSHKHNGAALFLVLGVLLLLLGFGFRPHLLALSTWPPFLVPALFSLAYGGYLFWRQKHPLR